MNGLIEVPSKWRLVQKVREVEVTDPVAASRPHDYADAFELRLPERDQAAPADWMRAGLAATPVAVDWIASLLGHRQAPVPSPNVIEGFRVIQSTAEVVQLEYSLPLFDVVLVGRQVGASTRRLTSLVIFRRGVVSRLLFAVIRPGHRWAARRVVSSIAAAGKNGRGHV